MPRNSGFKRGISFSLQTSDQSNNFKKIARHLFVQNSSLRFDHIEVFMQSLI